MHVMMYSKKYSSKEHGPSVKTSHLQNFTEMVRYVKHTAAISSQCAESKCCTEMLSSRQKKKQTKKQRSQKKSKFSFYAIIPKPSKLILYKHTRCT